MNRVRIDCGSGVTDGEWRGVEPPDRRAESGVTFDLVNDDDDVGIGGSDNAHLSLKSSLLICVPPPPYIGCLKHVFGADADRLDTGSSS